MRESSVALRTFAPNLDRVLLMEAVSLVSLAGGTAGPEGAAPTRVAAALLVAVEVVVVESVAALAVSSVTETVDSDLRAARRLPSMPSIVKVDMMMAWCV